MSEIVSRPTPPRRSLPILSIVALLIAIAGLFLPGDPKSTTVVDQDQAQEASTLRRVMQTRTLRVGYEGYPPYAMKDPATGKLSGFSVDLAEYIAREADWKVEWIQTSPETKITDLQAGRFDVMTEPIFRTIPRATRVTFSRPYAYFGDAAGIVRKGETRFNVIDDLNKPGVVVAVRQGYTDQTFASDNLPAATIRALKVDDVSQLFLEVITGKADVALSDLEQVKAFVEEHPDVEARFVDPAPAYIPAGFMLRQGDFEFYNFLNAALDYAESNSVIARLNRKYGLSPGLPPGIH